MAVIEGIKWGHDMQGKQNYDGAVVALSTRLWPPSYRIDRRWSACATLTIGGLVLAEERFDDETEEGLKALVEAWLEGRAKRIQRLLTMGGDDAG